MDEKEEKNVIGRRTFVKKAAVTVGAITILPSFAVTGCKTNVDGNDDYTPPVEEDKSIKFGVCTDVHRDIMYNAQDRMEIFVKDMEDKKADFIIQMGDFCYPEKKNDPFFAVFKRFGDNAYSVLGNHDRDNHASKEDALKYFEMPSAYYSFDKKDFHFIVLDGNERATNDTSHYPKYISSEQLDWLKKDLEETDKKSMIFIHQSLFDSHGVDNRNQVRSVIEAQTFENGDKKVIACFNGHSHMDEAKRINGIWYATINSMSYKWGGDSYKHKHDGYPDSAYDECPDLIYTFPYKDSLFALITVNPDGTITIEGRTSEWVTPTPEDLGYAGGNLPDTITPKISSRVFD
jgi:predicted phosphodiesterase